MLRDTPGMSKKAGVSNMIAPSAGTPIGELKLEVAFFLLGVSGRATYLSASVQRQAAPITPGQISSATPQTAPTTSLGALHHW